MASAHNQGPSISPDSGPKDDVATATATCYCGSVQLAFPVEGADLVDTFVCNCRDCRKITASMFASNFTVEARAVQHLRGREKLSQFTQAATIESGNTMTSHFCSVCGTLMYRVSSGSPGRRILRIGTVDDFDLHETKLRPRNENFVRSRVAWFTGVEGAEKHRGAFHVA
ncbi:Mss4-like protein [Xylariaceae sp. FL0662B]|nr:Mss4-like protein [Xylariaceae sp. FL0662B]